MVKTIELELSSDLLERFEAQLENTNMDMQEAITRFIENYLNGE